MPYEIAVNKLPKLFSIIKHSGVQTIFEVGARDCLESIALSRTFTDAEVFSFECNPATLPFCRENIQTSGNKKIHLTEKAVCDVAGEISFFQIDQEKTQTTIPNGNPGVSSLFQASGKYPIETYIQKKITVPATTLFNEMRDKHIESIDLLWMDVQGAEILVFKGAGDSIDKIKLIHTEVNFFPIYTGQPMFLEIQTYLKEKGFLLYTFTTFGKYSGDAVFVHKKYIRSYAYMYVYVKSYLLYPTRSVFQKSKELLKKILKKCTWYTRLCKEKVWVYYAKFKNRNKKIISIKKSIKK